MHGQHERRGQRGEEAVGAPVVAPLPVRALPARAPASRRSSACQPVAASRSAAMSGTRPTMKNTVLMVRYVEIANTSHTSGDLKFGQR